MPNPFRPILAIATAAHFADQLLLAGLPLLLTAGGQSAGAVAFVVAAHAAAWLLVSLPVGACADVVSRRRIMAWGSVTITLGAVLCATLFSLSGAAPAPLALASFVTAAGVVMIVLAIFAVLPRLIEPAGLARANASLEFGRAVMAIVAPSLAAFMIARGYAIAVFVLAVAGGLAAMALTRAVAAEGPRLVTAVPFWRAIGDGAAFVAREPLLRAIALCAIFWNMAFFGLTALFVPYAVTELRLSLVEAGQAWSVYGGGLLLGALAAPVMIARLPTGFMFWFGPVVSALGALVMVLSAPTEGVWPVWFAFFCIGFGPMTWLVLQTSVRQIVTPPDKLGRVGATITTAIYGVRPLGAAAAGLIAQVWGTHAALWLTIGLFGASALSIVLSPAARLRVMPVRAT